MPDGKTPHLDAMTAAGTFAGTTSPEDNLKAVVQTLRNELRGVSETVASLSQKTDTTNDKVDDLRDDFDRDMKAREKQGGRIFAIFCAFGGVIIAGIAGFVVTTFVNWNRLTGVEAQIQVIQLRDAQVQELMARVIRVETLTEESRDRSARIERILEGRQDRP